MAYVDKYTLSKDATFINRVEACLVENAKFIANSSGESSQRKGLAYLILNNTRNYAVMFASGVATDATVAAAAGAPAVQDNVTDAQINGAIAAIYNNYIQPA